MIYIKDLEKKNLLQEKPLFLNDSAFSDVVDFFVAQIHQLVSSSKNTRLEKHVSDLLLRMVSPADGFEHLYPKIRERFQGSSSFEIPEKIITSLKEMRTFFTDNAAPFSSKTIHEIDLNEIKKVMATYIQKTAERFKMEKQEVDLLYKKFKKDFMRTRNGEDVPMKEKESYKFYLALRGKK